MKIFKKVIKKGHQKRLVMLHEVIYSAKQDAKNYGLKKETFNPFKFWNPLANGSSTYYADLYIDFYTKFLNDLNKEFTREEKETRNKQHEINNMSHEERQLHYLRQEYNELQQRISAVENKLP